MKRRVFLFSPFVALTAPVASADTIQCDREVALRAEIQKALDSVTARRLELDTQVPIDIPAIIDGRYVGHYRLHWRTPACVESK